MPDREQMLRARTHKDDGLSMRERIYYTLTDEKGLEVKRTAKALALLLQKLSDEGGVTEEEIDDLLLEVVS